MYPKFPKCNFGPFTIEDLGYRGGTEGISPSRDKVKAIEVWPEVLQNDIQVKQLLSNY